MMNCNNEICPLLTIELVALSRGKYAIVDDSDFEELSKHKWYAGLTSYGELRAVRTCTVDGKQKTIYMHRQIMGSIRHGEVIDHLNHNPLDNRRSNLRVCTNQQNLHNKKPQGKSSNYKGVYWAKHANKWRARIQVDGKFISLGLFNRERDAAEAYNAAAKEHFGKYAHLNNVA